MYVGLILLILQSTDRIPGFFLNVLVYIYLLAYEYASAYKPKVLYMQVHVYKQKSSNRKYC